MLLEFAKDEPLRWLHAATIEIRQLGMAAFLTPLPERAQAAFDPGSAAHGPANQRPNESFTCIASSAEADGTGSCPRWWCKSANQVCLEVGTARLFAVQHRILGANYQPLCPTSHSDVQVTGVKVIGIKNHGHVGFQPF